MAFKIFLEKKAKRQIEGLDQETKRRILESLKELEKGFSARLDIKKQDENLVLIDTSFFLTLFDTWIYFPSRLSNLCSDSSTNLGTRRLVIEFIRFLKRHAPRE